MNQNHLSTVITKLVLFAQQSVKKVIAKKETNEKVKKITEAIKQRELN